MTRLPRIRGKAPALAAIGVVALSLGLTWRATTLIGLPDIGDPFDVAAYADAVVPDDRNAFVLYRLAAEKSVRTPPGLPLNWLQAPPEVVAEREKLWLAANKEALAIWRRGTERPDALFLAPRSVTWVTPLTVAQQLRDFARLATVEAGLAKAAGDPSAALDWHLAVLRSSRHVGRRGTTIERLIGIALHARASAAILHCAADPGLETASVRRALEAAVAAGEAAVPTSETYKCEYIVCMNTLADPNLLDLAKLVSPPPPPAPWPSPAVRRSFDATRRILKREPERSRRVLRLIVANRLAGSDLPATLRPKLLGSPEATPNDPSTSLINDLYDLDPTAPAAARALPPAELVRWYESTIYAKILHSSPSAFEAQIARERANQANLVISLANELYKRERGDYPDRAEDLVGAYLKALPEGHIPTR